MGLKALKAFIRFLSLDIGSFSFLLSLADDPLMVTPLDSPFLLFFLERKEKRNRNGESWCGHKEEIVKQSCPHSLLSISFISVGKRERSFSCHRFFLSFPWSGFYLRDRELARPEE